VSAPLQWFPRLLRATARQRAKWELIGVKFFTHKPVSDFEIRIFCRNLAAD